MGAVYRVRDVELGELVALKLLRADLTAEPDALERFRDEVRLARRVTPLPPDEVVARLPQARPSRAMRAVYEYIRAHYEEEIRLRVLAAIADVHEVYLVRSFRHSYGLTPHALQIELRLDAARRALLGGLSCAAAATLAGFHDQSHMTRHFKRNLGVTPGRFAAMR